MADRYIVIPNWNGEKGFQHYKDRAPKWIKVYTELLSKDEYLGLTGDQRAILHGLWLEYARSSSRLPADTRSLTRRLNLRVTAKQLQVLNHAGFIEVVASRSLAKRAKAASPEVEKEKETPISPLTNGHRRGVCPECHIGAGLHLEDCRFAKKVPANRKVSV